MDSSPGGTFLRPIGAAKIPGACRKPSRCINYRRRLMGLRRPNRLVFPRLFGRLLKVRSRKVAPMKPTVFISYRRQDTPLKQDVLNRPFAKGSERPCRSWIPPQFTQALSWPARIRDALRDSAIVIVVIGPEWLRTSDEWGKRRIDQKADWVRQELAVALSTKDKTVIPVLVRDAVLPPPDAYRNRYANSFIGRQSKFAQPIGTMISTYYSDKLCRATARRADEPWRPVPSKSAGRPRSHYR